MNGHLWATEAVLAVAQSETGIDIEIGTTDGLVGGAVSAFLTTLVLGAIMVAVAPEHTDRLMAEVLEDPVGAFVYGIVSLLGLALLISLLVITIVGVFVALPLAAGAYLAWAVGATIGYLAVADRLVGREDGWPKPLLVAAGINGALALTGIGFVVSICVGAVGFGVVLHRVLE